MARALAGSACAGSSAAAASGSSTPPYIICASYTGTLSAARERPEHGGQKGYGEPPTRLSASFRTFHRSARTAAAELFGRAMSEGALDGALRRRKPRGQTTPVISQQALRHSLLRARSGREPDQAAQDPACLRPHQLPLPARQSGAPRAAHRRLLAAADAARRHSQAAAAGER